MNSVWRTVEDWTTYQDQIWFLALLAWSGVIVAELRARRSGERRGGTTWLTALAGCYIAEVLVQLVLLVQELFTPYMKLDAAMGGTQALAAAVVVWAATDGRRDATRWRWIGWVWLVAAAVARWWWPVEGGLALCLAQTLALLGLVRRKPDALPKGVVALLTLGPLIATHGPWAYAIGHGRRNTDWSHFALADATCLLLVAIWIAARAWRQQLHAIDLDAPATARLRRDLRVAVFALAGWVVCGLALAVWYGRQARQAFEDNIIQRLQAAADTLDPTLVARALGPELRITKIELMHYSDGRPVVVATTPRTADPLYAELHSKLEELAKRSGEWRGFSINTIRSDELLLLDSSPRKYPVITHVIHHHATRHDYERVASRKSSVEGPYRSPAWATRLLAYVPLFDPANGAVLGWLSGELSGTRWTASFVLARLQTMVLVGVGVGFWTLSIAYRLRRETRDVAERKAAESAAADQLKSAFLAKVSHELRTPIQSVLGYGELLGGAALPEPQASWVQAMRAHGTIMLRLVNDLIDMGALQSGAFRLELSAVNLRAVVDECVVALSPAAAEKGLLLQMKVAPDVPAWIRTDGVRLRQILLNLLKNAVKFTPSGRVELTVQRHEGEIEFIVSDTGPGIPADLRGQLFKPFARLAPNASAGSGLGLALVHGLVQAMGGEVWLDEGVAQGATFVARLPVAPCAEPAAATPVEATQFSLHGMTVLLAEDNTLVAELLRTFLSSHGATVVTATDGVTAEQLAKESKPDVLLLDIGLPERDGIAVARNLRRDASRALRIVGLSAHAGPAEEARARDAGMDEFLTKPVNLAHLGQVLGSTRKRTVGTAATMRIDDPKLRALLASQFAQETPHVLEQMQAAASAQDWAQLRNRAHYLKNSADVIGAADLQAACRKVMQIDGAPDLEVVRRLIDAVTAAVPAAPSGGPPGPDSS